MIITKLGGGLGNQMFQYAIGRHLALKNDTQLVLDIFTLDKKNGDTPRTYGLDVFNISAKIAPKNELISHCPIKNIFSRIFRRGYIRQRNNYFDKKILSNKKRDICLEGFWQCEDYFKDIKDIIKQDFKIKIKPDKQNKAMLRKIKATNSVCLHVRRGDYILDPKINKTHGLCSLNYYYNSINEIKKTVKNPALYIFSDDIPWAKDNLKTEEKTVFVDINETDKAYEDLRLMSNCKHFIIANSSFSWWAAWLSDSPNKIVCAPEKWFNQGDEGDIVPKSWTRIKV